MRFRRQDALLTVWKRWDSIVTHPNPHALILHICLNAAHDVLRCKVRQGKWIQEGAIPENIPDSSASAVQYMPSAEQHGQALWAIGLPPRCWKLEQSRNGDVAVKAL